MSAPRKFSAEEWLNLERNAVKILGMTLEQARYLFIEKRGRNPRFRGELSSDPRQRTEGNDMNTPPKPTIFAATHRMHVRQGLPVPEVEPLDRKHWNYVEIVGCGGAIGYIPGHDYSLKKKPPEPSEQAKSPDKHVQNFSARPPNISNNREHFFFGLDGNQSEPLEPVNFVRSREPNDPLEPLDVDPATAAALTAVWEQAARDAQQILRGAGQRGEGPHHG